MRKILTIIVLMGMTNGVHSSNFDNLTINITDLKNSAENVIVEPMGSEDYIFGTEIESGAVQSPDPQVAGIISDGKIKPPVAPDINQVSTPKWYGRDSRQARMKFTSYMLYKIPGNYTGPVSNILNNRTQMEKIWELVHLQVKHMYGAFTMHPNFVDTPGIPSGDYKVTLLGAEDAGGRYAKIIYSYEDTVVFAKSLFNGSRIIRIHFVLPKDPTTIYKKGFTSGSSTNRCTDAHYNSEGDFWYFWNPWQRGCPITEDDLVRVQSDLQMLDITHNTYPEYDKLYDNGVMYITYLVGVDENFQSGDLGRKTFESSFNSLKTKGFEVELNQKRHKRLSLSASGKNAVIDMYLVDPNSTRFAKLVVNAMKTSDIFLYDGHSGLGGYLNPDTLSWYSGEQLTLPKNKYQIFYFNGCSTYAYYNKDFFNLKRTSSDLKGTKNLDIITTGIGASFSVGSKVDVTFLTTITSGRKLSWQTILNRINDAEGFYSALTHVNGDEDNPKTP